MTPVRHDASSEFARRFWRYGRAHPIASLATVGGQVVVGSRALQYLDIDLVRGRFHVGEFIATFSPFSTVGDLWLAIVKPAVFGVIVAIISCHKGLDTRGGPAGVANSVNAAVLEAVPLMMIVNVLMSELHVTAVVPLFLTALALAYLSSQIVSVGVAAGRAMRASVTTVMAVNMLLTMALWGVIAGARFGG